MTKLKYIYTVLSNYFDVLFVVKFAVLLAVLYYFNIFFIGITDPGGAIYSSFLTHHLDYISWLRTSILAGAHLIVKLFGVNAYISDAYSLKAINGHSVIIGFTCIGYGLMSFWAAFIIAQSTAWKRKVIWVIAGIVLIWFINCWRVGVLLIALQNNWKVNSYINHHDMFNLVAYALIIAMIYLYYKKSKKEDAVTEKENTVMPSKFTLSSKPALVNERK